MIGWIKLHRRIINSRVFSNEGLLKVWVYCLCRANHELNYVPITTGKGTSEVEVEPGEFVFGRKSAASDLKMNESTVYKRMKKLEKMGNLTMQSNTHYSIVTICNWEVYQDDESEKEQAKEQPSNNQVTGKEQPSNTDKNDKNVKNDKKINIPFEEFWDSYGKKVGSKKKSKTKWEKLSDKEREEIMEHIRGYVNSFDDKQYQPHPETFLNGKRWEAEGYKSNGKSEVVPLWLQ